MTPQDIKDKMETVEALYQEYTAKLNALEAEGREIFKEYVRALEQKKIETLKKIIHGNGTS